ncbi:methyltransferase [Streptoalloteichus hindustanus]|uniref:methyltransferase n=1 Tax=Streptoalloteichus hindustanus TaxID=2017 RepID=UPI002E149665|nr:methyltransferase [Streptoalloteichus hindustanus]
MKSTESADSAESSGSAGSAGSAESFSDADAGRGPGTLDMAGLSRILLGHAAFQYLNAACELELFELLRAEPDLDAEQVGAELGLAERATDILLLGCTALGLVTGNQGRYRVAAVVAELMATEDWRRFRDIVAFEQYVVYEGQADFTESLRTNSNVGLRRVPGTGVDLYRRLAQNPHLESVFYRYMRSWSELAHRHLVERLDWSDCAAVLDCGGGDAVNAIALARAQPRMRVTVLEIPATAPIAARRIAEAGLTERVSVAVGDMFTDPFPTGFDCVLFAHQMVIWTPEECTALLRKAHAALRPGGRVVLFNSMSHDEGDGPVVAALDSVYFAALPAEGGMIYPWSRHERNLRAAGFGRLHRIPCPGWTPHGILVGHRD